MTHSNTVIENALRKLRWIVFLFIVWLVVPGFAAGQSTFSGANMVGLAGGTPAAVRGTEATLFNPANLSLRESRAKVVVSIANITAFGGGSLFQFGPYNDYLTEGRHLSDDDIGSLLDDWFGDTASREIRDMAMMVDVVPLAIVIRTHDWAFGVSWRTRAYARLGFGRGWLDLMMRGTSEPRSIPLDSRYQTIAMSEISMGISRQFGDLHVGVAPKLLFGHTFSDGTLTSTAEITEDAITHDFDYMIRAAGVIKSDFTDEIDLFNSDPFDSAGDSDPFSAVAGTGIGADLGVTWIASPRLLVAMSITDLGMIKWTKDTETIRPVNNSFVFEGFELNRGRLDDEFDGEFGQYASDFLDSLATDSYEKTTRIEGGFTTYLPARMHVGASYRLGHAVFNLGATLPLNNSIGNLSGSMSSTAGATYQLGPLSFRTGARIGGGGALTLGYGLGIQTRAFDLGLSAAVTPRSDVLGSGGRVAVAVSLANIKIR